MIACIDSLEKSPTKMGDKIRILRKKKGLSLEKLGAITETSKSYIWELENRDSCNPTSDKLVKISQALDVTTDYLTNDKAELSNDVLSDAFFRKFTLLSEENQIKIKQIIDIWSKNE